MVNVHHVLCPGQGQDHTKEVDLFETTSKLFHVTYH